MELGKTTQAPASPSRATNPDLDWSQVRETISMLCLAVAQIEASLSDSAKSVDELTQSFTTVASHVDSMANNLASLNAESVDHYKESTKDSCQHINLSVSQAITAFQFYDRITQRLDHVSKGLFSLKELISDPSQLYNPMAWNEVQSEVKESYSMEVERLMFEHIMQGASVEEALEIYHHNFADDTPGPATDGTTDEIELF